MIMMMMIKFRIFFKPFLFILLLGVVHTTLRSQETDFQTWFEASLEKKLDHGFDLSASFDQRFKENSLRYDRSMITVVGQYDLGKGFDVSLGARWILVENSRMEIENRFRFHTDIKYKIDINSFYIGLRSRLQYGFDDQVLYSDFSENKLANRNRIETGYHIFGTRFTLAAGFELYLHINHYDGPLFYRTKSYAGVNYDFNSRNSIELSYLYDHEFNIVAPSNASVIGISYKYEL